MQNNKIFICNYWWNCNNYGALLTAFAINKLVENSYLVNDLRINFYKAINKKYDFSYPFKRDFLKTEDIKEMYLNLEKLNDISNTFITGSDQVFRGGTIYDGRLSQYFLDFVKPDKKKIAFSASFGVDKEQFLKETSKETIEKMKNSLKSFDFISVREKSGIEICNDIFNVDAEWIIDPVFILDKCNYDDLIKNASNSYKNKIVAYTLDTSKEYKKAYKYLSKKYNKKVIETANSNISVENWLKSIRDCDLFLTDSFHGMCFAIIFNKPFICISNKSRGGTRFNSICEMLDIKNQCIDSINEIYKINCIFEIEYEKVNSKIEKERQKGLNLLKTALETPTQITQEKIDSRNKYLVNRIIELENQNNLNFQLKRWLWYKWLITFHNLPEFIKSFIQYLRGKR